MKILHQLGGSKLAIDDVALPVPKTGEVLIKTTVSALCGSEMSTYRGDGRPTGNLGHEAAGVVAAVGPDTSGRIKVGQRVGVSAIVGWNEQDENYRAGRYTWCDKFTFHCDMHAEYFTIPEQGCHILPDEIPWDVGVLITGDGLGVPYHTSRKLISVDIQTVVVYGLGPIGLGSVLLQTFLGRRVIGVDRSPERVEIAKRLGATDTVLSTDGVDVVARIIELTNGRGADVAIEAAGIPVTAKLCFPSVRKGGTVVFNGEQPSVTLSPSEDFIRRDITAVGSWFYHFSEYSEMRALYESGLAVSSLITHRFPFSQADEAYRSMAEGRCGKVLLTYGND